MKKKNKGFTLIELLAVIVILGLLMAIAIPSVTKYITESRKKTLTTTLGNYIGALVNEVNDLSYTFTGTNTIYAVPIECIALERGGTDPFGHWYQANDAYFAYVLVQYDDTTSKYVYGFTFKDSAGYGLYPTIQANIKEKGSQIKTGYDLNKPSTGDITSLTTLAKWQESGFVVDSTTHLQVLEATLDGEVGNGKTTCTLCQKGDNYAQIEEEIISERYKPLSTLVLNHNSLITKSPTLTAPIHKTSDQHGLYRSYATNNGKATYYFRGSINNNYVSFAGFNWRIVRINETGTIKLIGDFSTDSELYAFTVASTNYKSMYYSNSTILKPVLDNWYKANITDKGFDSYVATEMFCEQVRVKFSDNNTFASARPTIYTSYTPNFRCSNDSNGKGVLNLKVGLLNYDETVFAGEYYSENNSACYLSNSLGKWTMTPVGYVPQQSEYFILGIFPSAWGGFIGGMGSSWETTAVPVINLKADVLASGTGTSTDPYVIKTN